MRREHWLLCAILLPVLGLALMPAIPVTRSSNPPVRAGRTMEDYLNVSGQVEGILNRACKDCHSNETRWPWYASVAPVSWMVAGEVERARHAMNFSEWGPKPRVAMGRLMTACESVETGRMPPASYRRMHPKARLSAQQAAEFCGWTQEETLWLRGLLVRAVREEGGEER
jgi:hypothetical protein